MAPLTPQLPRPGLDRVRGEPVSGVDVPGPDLSVVAGEALVLLMTGVAEGRPGRGHRAVIGGPARPVLGAEHPRRRPQSLLAKGRAESAVGTGEVAGLAAPARLPLDVTAEAQLHLRQVVGRGQRPDRYPAVTADALLLLVRFVREIKPRRGDPRAHHLVFRARMTVEAPGLGLIRPPPPNPGGLAVTGDAGLLQREQVVPGRAAHPSQRVAARTVEAETIEVTGVIEGEVDLLSGVDRRRDQLRAEPQRGRGQDRRGHRRGDDQRPPPPSPPSVHSHTPRSSITRKRNCWPKISLRLCSNSASSAASWESR